MKQKLITLIVAALVALPAWAITPAVKSQKTESLTYDVYFHMGFIWARAGQGTLSLYNEEDGNGQARIHGQLAAKSLNIVEHIMKVRDTLDCWFTPEYVVKEYVKKTHEGKYNCIEHNYYKPYVGPGVTTLTPSVIDSTQVHIHRWLKKGKDPSEVRDVYHSVEEPGYDMLSLFYVMRRLNFAELTKGQTMKYACFSGIKKDWINVEYKGTERIKLRNGKQHDSYLIYLTFATKGQDSTPLQVWLSQTPDHRPLKVIIGLKRIGSVQGEIVE